MTSITNIRTISSACPSSMASSTISHNHIRSHQPEKKEPIKRNITFRRTRTTRSTCNETNTATKQTNEVKSCDQMGTCHRRFSFKRWISQENNRNETSKKYINKTHRKETSKKCTSKTQSHSVSFSDVQVQEYPLVLGDNPSCSEGLPLSLGWVPSNSYTLQLDQYEDNRPERRTFREMKMTAVVRKNILLENSTSEDLRRVERRIGRERKINHKCMGSFFMSPPLRMKDSEIRSVA